MEQTWKVQSGSVSVLLPELTVFLKDSVAKNKQSFVYILFPPLFFLFLKKKKELFLLMDTARVMH